MGKIQFQNVNKVYPNGFHAIHDFNLDVDDGEFIVFVGPSGCGKSTVLRMLAGLEEITSGQLLLDGKVINNRPPVERDIAIVFQDYALYGNLSVYDNVGISMKVQHQKDTAIYDKVQQAAATVDIQQYLNRLPGQLSGGQKQRVALARSIIRHPKAFLMDEPLSNLDAKLRLEMRYELQRLHVETGSTFVYVTHDQMEAMTLATKICLIENGVLQQYDAPLDVYAKPNNVFVADFVGNPAINFIDASGAQQSDGTLTLSALDGMQLSFRPKEPLDVAAWYERADAEDKARRDAENARALDKKSVEKGNKDVLFRYHVARVNETEDFGDEAALTDGDFVLGVRPEFLRLSDSGAIEGEIYSAMPTGMESTIKVRIGDFLLTGVVFGSSLFTIGAQVPVSVSGEDIMLFDRKSGRCIAFGSLSF